MLGIEEGTDDDTLETYIGHIEGSAIELGNVCLVAHSRGHKYNYFERLDLLEEGDLIYYTVDNKVLTYKVYESLVFYKTDLSEFEQTKDNRITLVTEIFGRENYMLCVQAVEFEE